MLLSKYLSFSTTQHIKNSTFFLVLYTIWLFHYNWHIGNFLFFSSLKIIVRNKKTFWHYMFFFVVPICFNYLACLFSFIKAFHVSLELVNLQREKYKKKMIECLKVISLFIWNFIYVQLPVLQTCQKTDPTSQKEDEI